MSGWRTRTMRSASMHEGLRGGARQPRRLAAAAWLTRELGMLAQLEIMRVSARESAATRKPLQHRKWRGSSLS